VTEVKRADPFAVTNEPDISAFPPTQARKPPVARQVIREVSERSDFPSRSPRKDQRRHRTGRNIQFNLKVTQQTIDEFMEINDTNGWVFGETLQHLIDAFKRK
jgi:hypothetical protein